MFSDDCVVEGKKIKLVSPAPITLKGVIVASGNRRSIYSGGGQAAAVLKCIELFPSQILHLLVLLLDCTVCAQLK